MTARLLRRPRRHARALRPRRDAPRRAGPRPLLGRLPPTSPPTPRRSSRASRSGSPSSPRSRPGGTSTANKPSEDYLIPTEAAVGPGRRADVRRADLPRPPRAEAPLLRQAARPLRRRDGHRRRREGRRRRGSRSADAPRHARLPALQRRAVPRSGPGRGDARHRRRPGRDDRRRRERRPLPARRHARSPEGPAGGAGTASRPRRPSRARFAGPLAPRHPRPRLPRRPRPQPDPLRLPPHPDHRRLLLAPERGEDEPHVRPRPRLRPRDERHLLGARRLRGALRRPLRLLAPEAGRPRRHRRSSSSRSRSRCSASTRSRRPTSSPTGPGSKAGVLGALTMGLFVGFVAAPCIGPFVLSLLTYVAQQGSAPLGFGLFFTLAMGLGLPYLVLGTVSGSLKAMPRSGEWMIAIRKVFGFVLVALAAWFLRPLLPEARLRLGRRRPAPRRRRLVPPLREVGLRRSAGSAA